MKIWSKFQCGRISTKWNSENIYTTSITTEWHGASTKFIRSKAQSQQTIPAAIEKDKMIFKINYNLYVKKKEQYENNIIKAYATIFDYCNKTIQAHIRELSNYKTKIQNDPIESMKVINQFKQNMHMQH